MGIQMDMFGGDTVLPVIEAKPIKPRGKAKSSLVAKVWKAVSELPATTVIVTPGADDGRIKADIAEMLDVKPIPRRKTVAPGGTLDDAGDATMDYLHGQLSASFQASVGYDAKLAMALVCASTLSHRGPVPTLSISGINLDSEQRTSAPCMIVREQRYEMTCILEKVGITPFTAPAAAIVAMMTLDQADLETIFAHLVARSALIAWDKQGAELLRATGVEPLADWRVEATYLKTLSTGQVRELADTVLNHDDAPPKSASRDRIEAAILEAAAVDSFDWSPPQLSEIE